MRNSDDMAWNDSCYYEDICEDVSSGMFVMPRGLFFRSMSVIYGWPWLVGMSVAFLLGLGIWLASADIRWFIVSLMMVFIVFPMLAAFLYFSHGLRPESFFNVVPHRLSVRKEGLEAVMYRLSGEDEDGSQGDGDSVEVASLGNGFKEAAVTPRVIGRVFLPYASMRGYRVGHDSVTVPCGGGLIWLPMSAFASQDDMRRMIDIISAGVRSHRSPDRNVG